MFENLDQFNQRKEELEKKLAANTWESRDEFIKLTKEYNRVNQIVSLKVDFDNAQKRLKENLALVSEHKEDPEFSKMIEEDSRQLEEQLKVLEKKNHSDAFTSGQKRRTSYYCRNSCRYWR